MIEILAACAWIFGVSLSVGTALWWVLDWKSKGNK